MSDANNDIKDGEFAAGRMAIMCTGVGPELFTFPPGAQIFPLIPQDELWEIVQSVAEADSVYCYNDCGPNYECPFCDGYAVTLSGYDHNEFPHKPECIVTKARTLVERRKAQPQITVKVRETE